MALIVREGRYKNLLFAFPENIHTANLNIQKIEQLCEDDFLLTYEIPMADRVSINAAEYPVTVVGTNSYYPHLMGYVSTGAFFSGAAWEGRQKHAVLNETAAFTIFGSYRVAGKTIKLKGEVWLVTGVLTDGDDENSIIYVPSSVSGGTPKSLAVLTAPGRGIDEAYVKSVLKTLGIHEANYRIVNADRLSRVYGERVSAAVMVLFCVLFVCVCLPVLSKLYRGFAEYRATLQYKTYKDIVAENRGDLVKKAAAVFLLLTGAAIVLVLLPRILVILLGWRDAVFFSDTVSADDFRAKIALLKEYHQLDKAVFGAFLLLTGSIPVLLFAPNPLATPAAPSGPRR
jgi:hypothetical protein